MDKSQYIGITEAGEVAFNLDVFDRLYDGNIIITKRLTPNLISKLVEHKDKIILHLTCTGMGGSKLEPHVPSYEVTYEKLTDLLQRGFPVEQVVLRVDPVIPTTKGIETASNVIRKFLPLGIKRIRWSSLDIYKHVKERFEEEGVRMPYETFNAPKENIESAFYTLNTIVSAYGATLETCGEYGYDSTPCLSQKDVDILGLGDKIKLEGSAEQRKSCKCPQNKHELIKAKPIQCKNKCLYCFWRGESEN